MGKELHFYKIWSERASLRLTFEWHPEVSKGVDQSDILREKRCRNLRNSKCKGPEAELTGLCIQEVTLSGDL